MPMRHSLRPFRTKSHMRVLVPTVETVGYCPPVPNGTDKAIESPYVDSCHSVERIEVFDRSENSASKDAPYLRRTPSSLQGEGWCERVNSGKP